MRNNTVQRMKSKEQDRDLYEENQLLKKALQGTKVFLNMVIHDQKTVFKAAIKTFPLKNTKLKTIPTPTTTTTVALQL